MMKIDLKTYATLLFSINWEFKGIHFEDNYLAWRVNFWRDLFPKVLFEALMGLSEGDEVTVNLTPEDTGLPYDESKVREIRNNQFRPPKNYPIDRPRVGRFYPGGFFEGVEGLTSVSIQPVRVIGETNGKLLIDLNHPLAGIPLKVRVKVLRVWPKESEIGGRCHCYLDEAIDLGPGMQKPLKEGLTDFSCPDAFKRMDESPDSEFYKKPRFVDHIDTQAKAILRELHLRFVSEGSYILDLMSSVTTHLPEDFKAKIIGLGLNEEELKANPLLSDYVIWDLNAQPEIPFPDNTFDALLCSLSIEYLTQPELIIKEMARVLKPGGKVIISFSNRWFPPKVIKLWTELHEFERLGWVLQMVWASNLFKDLFAFSSRNWPRPVDDKYFPALKTADPMYAVVATKA